LSLGGTTRGEKIVNEHGAVRDETIISDHHEFADKRVGLDSASLANYDSPLDFDKWSYEAIVTDLAAVEVDRLDNRDALPKRYVDDPDLSNRRFCRYVFHDIASEALASTMPSNDPTDYAGKRKSWIWRIVSICVNLSHLWIPTTTCVSIRLLVLEDKPRDR
jgi:hypothetical protein